MTGPQKVLVALMMLVCMAGAACASEEPSASPTGASPSPSPSGSGTGEPSPSGDPLLLAEGRTANGIAWALRLQEGLPLCVQLRRLDEVGDFMVCNEDSEQDFNGDERLRYAFGGLNPEETPKFVIGITDPQVLRVRIDLPEGESPEVDTVASPRAPRQRFFVVELPSQPAQEVQAIRGLDGSGKTVAGFSLGPPDEGPSPLPTG